MVFDKKLKLIFIHIPKTGGTSIEYALDLYGKIENTCGVKGSKAMQHFTWIDYEQFFSERIRHIPYNNYFKFSIVRNPYDRLISEYYWCAVPGIGFKNDQSFNDFVNTVENIVKNKNFKETVYHDHFIPQHHFIYKSDKLVVNKLFKFEKFNEIIIFLKQKYKINNLPHTQYQKYDKINLNYYQKLKIYNMYKKDFKLFGYKF